MTFEWMEYEEHDEKSYWKAREKLGMTEETILRDVNAIKKWLENHPYLPSTLAEANVDMWLDNYLLLNKNNLERVKSNLDTYFKIRTTLPEAFEERHPQNPDIKNSFQSTCVALMPKLTSNGHMIAIYHHLTTDISKFEVIPLGKRVIAMIDIQLQYTRINRVGTVLVCDLINSRLGHLTRYRPLRLIKAFFQSVWKAYPERVAQIHIINPPFGMQAALAFFKPFLKEKIRKRIMIHPNLESLYEWIPKSHLPADYGGDCCSLDELNLKWESILAEKYEWLEVCGKKHKIEASKWPQNDYKPDVKMYNLF